MPAHCMRRRRAGRPHRLHRRRPRWYLDLTEAGRRTVRAEPIGAALTLRGPAEALLLLLWGRMGASSAGVEVDGGHEVLASWGTLVPPM